MPGSVLIVGAGPGGACLAYLMAQAGVDVTLLERHNDFSREFRGERILEAGIAALKTMGLWDKIQHVKTIRLNRAEMYINKVPKVKTVGNDPNQGALYLPQPPFLTAVIEAAQTFPNFKFMRATAAMSMLYEDDRVIGIVAKPAEGEKFEIRADLVICAEGRYSRMRSQVKLEAQIPSENEDYDFIWIRMPAPEFMTATGTSQSYVGSGGTLVFAFNTPDGDMSMGWAIKKGSLADMKQVGPDEWFRLLMELLPDNMKNHMIAHKDQMTHALLNVLCYTLEKWWRPGILMMGDAAHPMSPSGGQGITSAFRDAIVAANLFIPVLRGAVAAQDLDATCQAFQEMRVAEILPIQAQQRRMSVMMMQKTALSRLMMLHIMPAVAKFLPGIMAKAATGGRKMRRGTELLLDPKVRGQAQA